MHDLDGFAKTSGRGGANRFTVSLTAPIGYGARPPN